MIPPGLSNVRDLRVMVTAAAVATAACLCWLAVVTFASWTCQIQDGMLVIRRRIFRRISLGATVVPLDDLRALERTTGRVPFGALLRGSPLAREGLVIVLKTGRRPRKVYTSPSDPDSLASQLAALTGAEVTAPKPGVRTFLDLGPLWLADLLALASAVSTGLALAIPRSIADFPGGPIMIAVAGALLVSMVLLMMHDSLRNPRARGSPWSALWPVVIVFAFPSAWLYYLLIWRRGHRPEQRHR